MSILTRPAKVPSYRLHRPSGRAVVRLDGKDHYLGVHGTEASHEAYRRIIAEWLTHRRPRPVATAVDDDRLDLTVDEVILAFWTRHAERHYRHADGGPTQELDNYRETLRPLRQLYGSTPARGFGPLALKAVRQAMIEAGLARTTINQRVGRIVHLFKWAVEHELVPPAVHHGLKAVAGLRRGRSAARETAPIKPVPEALVEAIRPHVARQVWAMIELQRLTGMRSGEVTIMRTADLDTSGPVWAYVPRRHKTEHRGRERTIYLGPRAQAVLRPWLRADRSEYLFSPREAMAEFRAEQRRRRTTPLYPSQRARRPKENPKRRIGDRYSTRSYNHAIQYGCRRAGVAPWHPHQLRHGAATRLRKEYGLEVARVILGHASASTAEIYAEMDREKAIAVMASVG
jgi:integrase